MAIAHIYLVRHGETQENREGIIQGQLDTELNALGVEQAEAVAAALKDVPFNLAFTSDLQRAAKTAEAILKHHPSIPVFKHEALREIYMGDLQGKQGNRKVARSDPPNMETRSAFRARMLAWWAEAITKNLATLPVGPRTKPVYILVVSHGAYISTLVRALSRDGVLNEEARLNVGRCLNTSVTTIEMESATGGRLLKWGDVSHLLKPVVTFNADEVQ